MTTLKLKEITNQIDLTPNNSNVKPIFHKEISAITKLLEGCSYEQSKLIFKEARRNLNIRPEKVKKQLPNLLSEDEIESIIELASENNPAHATMLKLLYFCGLRVSEMAQIKVSQVNWKDCTILIHGKGDRDRIVLYPLIMKDEIRRYMFTVKENLKQDQQYLFTSREQRAFRRESIYQFIQRYANKAGIKKKVYPHLMRHIHLTQLTKAGLNEKQIMAQSGHSSKEILGIYQHLSGIDRNNYERAISKNN